MDNSIERSSIPEELRNLREEYIKDEMKKISAHNPNIDPNGPRLIVDQKSGKLNILEMKKRRKRQKKTKVKQDHVKGNTKDLEEEKKPVSISQVNEISSHEEMAEANISFMPDHETLDNVWPNFLVDDQRFNWNAGGITLIIR